MITRINDLNYNKGCMNKSVKVIFDINSINPQGQTYIFTNKCVTSQIQIYRDNKPVIVENNRNCHLSYVYVDIDGIGYGTYSGGGLKRESMICKVERVEIDYYHKDKGKILHHKDVYVNNGTILEYLGMERVD